MAEKSKDKLVYVYMVETTNRCDGGASKSELKTAWLNAMKKQMPYMAMKTFIIRTHTSEVEGCPEIQMWSKWGEGVFVAAFKDASEARNFYDILLRSKAVRRYSKLKHSNVKPVMYSKNYPE